MKFELFAAASLAATAGATLSDASPESRKMMWDAFKAEHGRHFSTEEEEITRYNIFVKNLDSIDLRNAEEAKAGGSAAHGITRFSDLTQEEFESRYLKYEPEATGMRGTATEVEVPPYEGSLSAVDWTGKYTTPVKDQGYCGSCWAFAATEQIESDAMRTLKKTYVLAPQQIVSCDKKDGGCNGGRQETAYDYVKNTGGQEQEKDYPYTSGNSGQNGSCKEQSSKFVLGVKSYSTVRGESSMGNYVKSTGPLSVCVDASNWNTYKGGIMTSCGTRINHAVQAVGVDTGSSGYWKVRNSWGPRWGESGFIRLSYGDNTCGISSQGSTYVHVKTA